MDGHEVISLTPRLRESPFQEFVEGFHVLQPPVLSRSNFTQITTKFDKASVPFRLLPLFPSQDFVDFGKLARNRRDAAPEPATPCHLANLVI